MRWLSGLFSNYEVSTVRNLFLVELLDDWEEVFAAHQAIKQSIPFFDAQRIIQPTANKSTSLYKIPSKIPEKQIFTLKTL